MPGRYMTPERLYKEFVCLAEQVEGGKKKKSAVCQSQHLLIRQHQKWNGRKLEHLYDDMAKMLKNMHNLCVPERHPPNT